MHQPLLLHGAVELRRGCRKKKRHLFLFRDFLVVSNDQHKKSCKIKNVMPLGVLWISECEGTVNGGHPHASRSFHLGWPMENFVAKFCSSEQRDLWCSLLQGYISETKEKGTRTSIPLHIFTEDIPGSASPLTMEATNVDTVNDIIYRSLTMLGITNNENDHQLWFQSGNKKQLYPLYGFEHPYIIKVWDLRNTLFTPRGSRSTNSFTSLQELVLEHESSHVQGRFLLKPRHTDRGQEQSQENAVERRPFVNWAFRQSSNTRQDKLCPALQGQKKKQIFGTSLMDACEDGDLPPEILNMISFITEQGPRVKGIFRTSASVQSCRALKEKLSSGEKVDLSTESVHTVASVLKNFLQNLQDCVLSSHLYDKWLDVTKDGSQDEKITAIQSLLEQLPKPNVVLLRHLFGMLKSIEKHSSTNKMTAYNLSVCIAPSILWLPTSCTTEQPDDVTKKISVIEFIIKNGPKIFGEDISSFLGESSTTCNDGEEDSVKMEQPPDPKPINIMVFYKGPSVAQHP